MNGTDRTDSRVLLFFVIFVAAPIFVASYIADDVGRGGAAVIGAGSVIFMARLTWPLKRYWWYWILLCLVSAAQVFLVVKIDWSWIQRTHGPHYLMLLPITILNMGVTYGCIRLVQWLASLFARHS